MSPDGEELDAYIIGPEASKETFRGFCVAVIHRLDDDDDKLVVVSKEQEDISDEVIRQLTYFQEQYFHSEILRKPSKISF